MSTDPGLWFLITNVCKPPKHFDFPEIAQPFRFVWFEEFPLVCYSRWEDKSYYMPCVLFGYENVGKSLQKTISNKEDSRKNINKTWKSSNRKTQKRQILFHRFLSEYTLPLPCYTCFWRGRMKNGWIGKIGSEGGPIFQKLITAKWEGREKMQNL